MTAIKHFLGSVYMWLEKKFPDKVVVSTADYLTLKARVDVMEKLISEERLKTIENEINKFNISLGFGGTIDRGIRQPFQR